VHVWVLELQCEFARLALSARLGISGSLANNALREPESEALLADARRSVHEQRCRQLSRRDVIAEDVSLGVVSDNRQHQLPLRERSHVNGSTG
jgi:hypothetical protein